MGESNDADIFTKNLMSAVFNRHIPPNAENQYVSMHDRDLSKEAVRDHICSNLEQG